MTKEEAINYLQQLYPNGGHCWLDKQRIEAIGMAVDALKEEPVSEDLEKVVEEIVDPTVLNAYGTKELARRLRNTICGTSVSEELEEAIDTYLATYFGGEKEKQDWPFIKKMAIHFANWQKQQDLTPSEDLGLFIDKLSKQFPEVSFAKLSRIAVRVAKWQREQFEKNRLKHCNSITNEQVELEHKFLDQHLDKYNRMPTFLDAIEYGMKLQKEQMMKDATEVTVHMEAGNYPYIPQIEFYDYDKDIPLAKEGDRYKVILIKED